MLTSHAFEKKNEKHWNKVGALRALQLFHKASRRIPAYRNLLKKNRIDSDSVVSIEDFARLPVLTKHNYIEQYPLIDRLWDGSLAQSTIIATSSGTTGEPVYWARGGKQEDEATLFHEAIYNELFDIRKHATLLIIGFPMGVYVSGIATALPSFHVSQLGYPLTLLTTGMNKPEIIRSMKNLSISYEQTILVGHPFFLKDILETAITEGVRLPQRNIKLFCCSEGFNEEWRAYVSKLLGGGSPRIFNTYGSSEFLLIGTETTFTVALREVLEKNPAQSEQLFGTKQTPPLFQYNPSMRYIEEMEGNLLFTGHSGVPLIRYALGDRGALVSRANLEKLLPQKSLSRLSKWQLPVVALRGRSDYAVVFYAANIYVEHIRGALDYRPFLSTITGKFAMRVDYTKRLDPFLEINIELRGRRVPLSKEVLTQKIRKRITNYLLRINMEYRSSVKYVHKDLRPRIQLRAYQDPEYFPVGLKQKFIIT